MKKTLEVLLYLWQLPQNLLGIVLLAIYGWHYSFELKGNNHRAASSWVHLSKRMRGGISLGRYIILSDLYERDPVAWYHERGHSIQSMMLGPLYLLIIGLPSLLHAAFYRYDQANPNRYYRFYTERWADKLGDVKR